MKSGRWASNRPTAGTLAVSIPRRRRSAREDAKSSPPVLHAAARDHKPASVLPCSQGPLPRALPTISPPCRFGRTIRRADAVDVVAGWRG